jgi:hypothetical protein
MKPSSGTEFLVLKLVTQFQNCMNVEPSYGTGLSRSSTGCPILARCQFGKVGVPVPELDYQCRNWNGAKMGSNTYNDIMMKTSQGAFFIIRRMDMQGPFILWILQLGIT